MICVSDKTLCCGCAACVQRCPKQCIELYEDQEGFLYPSVNSTVCNDCGLCEKVCPLSRKETNRKPITTLMGKNLNDTKRLRSSSGGVFIELAEKTIDAGGTVFGCVFDKNWEAQHIAAHSMNEVYPMMQSKYVQSRIGDTFIEAKQELNKGVQVLYTGTPCQIAALHSFLGKEYENLITMDFLCHGVPSPGVWRKYLVEARMRQTARSAVAGKNTVSSSLNDLPPLGGVSFRDKSVSGWKKFGFVLHQVSASKADKNSVLSCVMTENPYLRGFFSDVYLRPSCYNCKCKNGRSHADITVGDFWGVTQTMPEYDDDKGLSVILVNTAVGGGGS